MPPAPIATGPAAQAAALRSSSARTAVGLRWANKRDATGDTVSVHKAAARGDRSGTHAATLTPRMSHGRLLLGAATATGTCYLLWRFYRRRHVPGARPVASEPLQLDEEADTSLRRHSATVVSGSTTRSLRLHPDRPCRYDGFVRPRSEIVFQLELPASSTAPGVQVRALDASGDSLRLYWREVCSLDSCSHALTAYLLFTCCLLTMHRVRRRGLLRACTMDAAPTRRCHSSGGRRPAR